MKERWGGFVDGFRGQTDLTLLRERISGHESIAITPPDLEQAETFARQAKLIGGGPAHADVLLPGELEARTLETRRAGGLLVAYEIRRQISELTDELGVDIGPLGVR